MVPHQRGTALRNRLPQSESLSTKENIAQPLIMDSLLIRCLGCRRKPALVNPSAMGPEGIDIIWMQLQAQPWLQIKPRYPAGSQSMQLSCFLEGPFDKRLNPGIHRLKIA